MSKTKTTYRQSSLAVPLLQRREKTSVGPSLHRASGSPTSSAKSGSQLSAAALSRTPADIDIDMAMAAALLSEEDFAVRIPGQQIQSNQHS